MVVSSRLRYEARCRLPARHAQMHEGNTWPYFSGLIIWTTEGDFAYASPWVPPIVR